MEFLKTNAGKMVIVAIVLIATAVFFFAEGGDNSGARSDKAQFVDVSTGKMFWLERITRASYPVNNPESGQCTLMPCFVDESGAVKIGRRLRSEIQKLDKEGLNQVVDLETLVVRAAP